MVVWGIFLGTVLKEVEVRVDVEMVKEEKVEEEDSRPVILEAASSVARMITLQETVRKVMVGRTPEVRQDVVTTVTRSVTSHVIAPLQPRTK